MSKAMVAAIGVVGLVLAIVLVYHLKPPPIAQEPVVAASGDSHPLDQTDSEETASGEGISLGSLLGINKPAPPPIVFYVGRPPGEADAPDLSTPAVAVHSVLSLIDEGATDKLAPCFVKQIEDTVSELYPNYLGPPVELVEVVKEGESAEVVWKATVHTEFSLDGTQRSPGETGGGGVRPFHFPLQLIYLQFRIEFASRAYPSQATYLDVLTAC